MKKVYLIFVTLFLSYNSLFAVLPPFYQSSKEIKAILNDERLHESLGSGAMIEEIHRVEEGYVIRTHNKELLVRITYLSCPMPGPAKFEFDFEEPQIITPSAE